MYFLVLDGFAVGDNQQFILYEFLGCWFHSHPNCKMSGGNSPDPIQYEKTMEKMKCFEQVNYKVVYEWECDFRGYKNSP